MNISAIANALHSQQLSDVLRTVSEIKERIDFVHTPDFASFTSNVFPLLREIILVKIPPQFEDNDENKIRHTILEIFSRFPSTETLRSIVMDLLNIGLKVLHDDNEENAIISLKIMFDLHKSYRPGLESQAQPLVENILAIYKNMPSHVRSLFAEQISPNFQPSLSMQGNYLNYNSAMPPSIGSLPGYSSIQGQQQYLLSGNQPGLPGSLPIGMNMYPSTTDTHQLHVPPAQVQPLQLSMQLPSPNLPGISTMPTSFPPIQQANNSNGMTNPSDAPSSNSSITNASDSVATIQSNDAEKAASDSKADPNIDEAGTISEAKSGSKVFPPKPVDNRPPFQSQVFGVQSNAPSASVPKSLQPPLLGQRYQPNVDHFDPKYSYLQGQSPYLLSQMNPQSQQGQQPLLIPNSINPEGSDPLFSGGQPNLGNNNVVLPQQHQMFPNQMFQPMPNNQGSISSNSYLGMQMLPMSSIPMNLPMNMGVHVPAQTGQMHNAMPSQAAGNSRPITSLVPALHSLKLLAECPHILMFLFQIYFKSLQKILPSLMESIMTFVEFAPASLANKEAIKDLIVSQVKSLNFISIVYRMAPELISQYEGLVVSSVRQLLSRCPDEVVSIRKDLIHATKALMVSDLKRKFFVYIEDILDEEFFLGPARHSVLRSFALTAIIDYIHQVKDFLEPKHVVRVVHLFSSAMNDMSLDLTLHSSCCKLLYVLAESIPTFQMEHIDIGYYALYLIMRTISGKIECIYNYSKFCNGVCPDNSTDSGLLDSTKLLSTWFQETSPIKGANTESASSSITKMDTYFNSYSLKDVKQFTRTLFWGIKNLLVSFMNVKHNRSRHLSQSELQTLIFESIDGSVFSKASGKYPIAEMIVQGLHICSLFLSPSTGSSLQVVDSTPDDTVTPSTQTGGHAEVQEILEYMHSILCVVNSIHLREVFDAILPELYAKCKENLVYLYLLQHVVNSTMLTTTCLDVLICFLISNLADLSVCSANSDSNVMLRAFKLVLSSLSKFAENERLLRPKLAVLIVKCFRLAYDTPNPKNYYFLLKMIFRAITGGKFEHSYKIFAPFVPVLLQGFTHLIQQSKNSTLKLLLLELTLTMPARFAVLSPHFPVLLTHIAMALRFKAEVASIGLRTLETWIDYLNPDAVASMLHQNPAVAHSVISGICEHLKLSPHPYGSQAIKILGKLGCHNEQFIRGLTPGFATNDPEEATCAIIDQFSIQFDSGLIDDRAGEPINVDISSTVRAACEILQSIKFTIYPYSLVDSDENKFDISVDQAEPLTQPASLARDLNFARSPNSEGFDEYFGHSLLGRREKSDKIVVENLLSVTMLENAAGNVGLDSTALYEEINYVVKANILLQKQAAVNIVTKAMSLLVGSLQQSRDDEEVVMEDADSFREFEDERKQFVCEELLQTLLIALIEPNLRTDTKAYLLRLCKVAVRVLIKDCSSPVDFSAVDSLRLVTNPLVAGMIETICKLAADCRPKLQLISMWLLTELMNEIAFAVDVESAVMQSVTESVIYDVINCSTDRYALGSVCLLQYIFNKINISQGLLQRISGYILDSLVGVFQYCESHGEGSRCSNKLQQDYIALLDSVLTVYFPKNEVVSSFDQLQDSQRAVIAQAFAHVFDIVKSKRIICEVVLAKISALTSISTEEIVCNMKSTADEILQSSKEFDKILPYYHMGILSGMAFALNHYGSSLKLDEDIFQVLTQCYVVATSENLAVDNFIFESDSCFFVHMKQPEICRIEFPLQVSDSIEKRTIFLRMFAAVCRLDSCASVNVQLMLDNEARLSLLCKCVILLFNTLLIPIPANTILFEELLAATKKVLVFCKNLMDTADPASAEWKHVFRLCSQIKSCVREYCGQIHNIKSCSRSYLAGLAVIFEYFPSEEQSMVCNFILEHLKRVPDADMASSIWPIGQELIIGVSLLDLCQYIPLQVHASVSPGARSEISFDDKLPTDDNVLRFFSEAINSYFQMDAAKFRYRHVPMAAVRLEEPIIRFAARFKFDCVRYLLHPQNIYKQEMCGLLLIMITSPSPLSSQAIQIFSHPKCFDHIATQLAPLIEILSQCDVRSRERSNQLLLHPAATSMGMKDDTLLKKAAEDKRAIDQSAAHTVSSMLDNNIRLLETACNYLLLINHLLMKSNKVLSPQSALFKCLRQLWVASISGCRGSHHSSMPLYGLNVLSKLMKLLSRVWESMSYDLIDIDILMDILPIFKTKLHLQDFSSLSVFVKKSAAALPPRQKREIFSQFLTNLFNGSISIEMKTLTAQYIILPIAIQSFTDNSSEFLFDSNILRLVVQEIVINSSSENLKYFDGAEMTAASAIAQRQDSASETDPSTTVAMDVQPATTGKIPNSTANSSNTSNNSSGVIATNQPSNTSSSSSSSSSSGPNPAANPSPNAVGSSTAVTSSSTTANLSPIASLLQAIAADALKVELLKICSLLLEHCPAKLKSNKREFVKFAWNCLKSEDAHLLGWANVNLCRFFAAFESPAKIILQTYVALLKGFSAEAKDVIKTAVDVLIPCLPIRMPTEEFLRTIKWTKKLLQEETHNPHNLIHILQAIVRHPDVFYSYRNHLIPQMTTCMSRIGLPHNAVIENRVISLNMADVLINWEWCRLKRKERLRNSDDNASKLETNKRSALSSDGPSHKHMKVDVPNTSSQADSGTSVSKAADGSLTRRPVLNQTQGSTAPASAVASGLASQFALDDRDNEKTLNHVQIHMIANFIIRLGSLACESKEPAFSKLSSRCTVLFRKMVSVYPFQGIKFNYFEKLLSGVSDQYFSARRDSSSASSKDDRATLPAVKPPNLSEASLIFFLEILLATLECMDGPSTLLLQNLPIFGGLCVWAMSCKNFAVHAAFRPLIKKVLQLYPLLSPPRPFAEYGFYLKFKELIDRNLILEPSEPTSSQTANQSTGAERQSLFLTLACLDEMIAVCPEWIEIHAQSLLKICNQLLSEHISRATKSSLKAQEANYFPSHANDVGQEYTLFSGQPLPSTVIYADYIANDGVHSFHGASASLQGSLIQNRLTSISPNCSTCALGISLLCKSLHRGLLSHHKEAILTLVDSVLEGSDNPYFLHFASQVCNAWIARPRSPLSSGEQWYLYSRIVQCFDRFPDYSIHPYSIRLSCISERIGSLFATCPTDFVQAFGSSIDYKSIDALGLLGILSALPESQVHCLRRLSNYLGPKTMPMLHRFLQMDFSSFNVRFIPIILQSLLLLNTDASSFNLGYSSGGHRTDSSSSLITALENLAVTEEDSKPDDNLIRDVCIISLTHCNSSEAFWKSYSNVMWKRLSDTQRNEFVSLIETFLLSHRFKKFCYFSVESPGATSLRNIPQWFLNTMLHLDPLPTFSIPFLDAMHNYYSAGCFVNEYLEKLVSLGSAQGNMKLSQTALVSVGSIYKHLKERGMLLSLYRMFTSLDLTDSLLSLEQYDKFFEANQLLAEQVDKHCKAIKESSVITSSSGSTAGYLYYSKDKDNVLSVFDLEVWEERWTASAQNLSKWGILLDVSQQQRVSDLALDCASIKFDWEGLRKLRTNPTNVAALENGLLGIKLIDVMVSIIENRNLECEKLCAQSVQLALHHWQKWPAISTGSTLHKAAFHVFHRVVELRESSLIMQEAHRAAKDKEKNIPEIKQFLKAWRLRLLEKPYFSQSIDSLMEWRLHIFNNVKNIYQSTPNRDVSLASTLVDTTWTLLSNARHYRKQRLPEVSLLSFHRLRAITSMEVSDIFTKIREQVLLSFSPIKSHLLAGLHLINTTNLDFFSPYQKSELFRLKALLLYNLEKIPEANEMFAHSVQVHRQHERAWACWANFCYDMLTQSYVAATDTSSASIVAPKGQDFIDVMQAARTIACLLRAVESNSAQAKHLLHRAIWLVTYADNEAHYLASSLYSHGAHLPVGVWVPVIGNLIDAACNICREEQSVSTDKYFFPLIGKVASNFPNAAIYELHSRASGKNGPIVAELCSRFIRQIRATSSSMNVATIDLAQHFALQLTSNLHANSATACVTGLGKFFLEVVDDSDIRLDATIASSGRQQLEAVREYADDFLKGSTASNATSNICTVIETKAMQPFCSELSNLLSYEKLTSGVALQFCKRWIDTLERAELAILNENRKRLSNLCGSNGALSIEMPGYYQTCGIAELVPKRHPRVISVRLVTDLVNKTGHLVSHVTRRKGLQCAKLEFVDDEGNVKTYVTRRGTVESGRLRHQHEFYCAVDWILQNNGPAVRRDMFVELQQFMPLSPDLILVSESPNCLNLTELDPRFALVKNQHWWEVLLEGRTMYEKIWVERIANNMGTSFEISKFAKKAVLSHFAQNTSHALLRRWLTSYNPCGNSYFVASRTLASQLGTFLALQFTCGTPPCGADEIVLGPRGLVNLNLSNLLDNINPSQVISLLEAGSVEDVVNILYSARMYSVNRLTRCPRVVLNALTPTMLLGVTGVSFGATLDAMCDQKQIVETHLCHIYSSELMALLKLFNRNDVQWSRIRKVVAVVAQKLANLAVREVAKVNPFGADTVPVDPLKPTPIRPTDKFVTNIFGESINEDNIVDLPLSFLAWF